MERQFDVRCRKCDQTFRFTVAKEGVNEILPGNALIALTLSRKLKITDPNIGSVVLGESPADGICSADYPLGHEFDIPTPVEEK